MTEYLKKNRVRLYLLLVIAALASLPLLQSGAWADAEPYRKGIWLLANLSAAVISYLCFGQMFDDKTLGMMGSMLYTWCPYRCSDLYATADIRDGLAWTFVPIVLLGMVWGYDTQKKQKWSWLILASGFTLLAVTSTAFFCVAVGAVLLWYVLMGRRSLCRQSLIRALWTALATLLLSGWVLIPTVRSLSDPAAAGALIPENFRMGGLYPAQYFSLFPSAGTSVNFAAAGAKGAQEMGMGAAVLLLLLAYLGGLFTGRFTDWLGKRMLVLAGGLLWLGSNLFPWDLLQNKNMLFSMVLALLQSPANWVVFAYAVLIWTGCRMLQRLKWEETDGRYRSVLVLTALVAFGMNQLVG